VTFVQNHNLREQVELVCLNLLQSEIAVAFSNLQLATAETRGGNAAHAAELIAKAIFGHRTVLLELREVSMEFEDEKRRLVEKAQELLEAIRMAEHRFLILLDGSA
jgi:hypothetical protein